MSLGMIQDNLVKTSLVQQTQTRGDDVQRGQEIGQLAAQREDDRQADQVVLQTRQKDEHGIRPDDERKEQNKKEDEEEEEENQEEESPTRSDSGDEEQTEGPRAHMRTINIVV